jgi:hypothetical protein
MKNNNEKKPTQEIGFTFVVVICFAFVTKFVLSILFLFVLEFLLFRFLISFV